MARLLIAIGCGAILAAPTTAGAAAEVPYSLELGVLTGPQGATFGFRSSRSSGEPAVSVFRQVRVQVNGKLIRELKDVAAPGGVAQVDLGKVARGATVSVKVHFRGDARQLQAAAQRRDGPAAAGSRRGQGARAAADVVDARRSTWSPTSPSETATPARRRPPR